jgi:hypothetical protein
LALTVLRAAVLPDVLALAALVVVAEAAGAAPPPPGSAAAAGGAVGAVVAAPGPTPELQQAALAAVEVLALVVPVGQRAVPGAAVPAAAVA